MLTDLVVRGLGVIEHAELRLGPGCTALTGETGAGKTLVVAALGLLLGGRADRALVRAGSGEAVIEGRFLLPEGHSALAPLVEAGYCAPGGGEVEVVLAREVGADGRGRARINGRLATAAALAEAGRHLVEIAGQHSAAGIGAPAVQRRMLDGFAGVSGLAEEVAGAVRRAAAAARAAGELASRERARARELDALRYEIAEIEAAAPDPVEAAELAARARSLEAAEAVAADLGLARDALSGEDGAAERAASAAAALRRAGARDPALEELAGRLEAAVVELTDVAADIAGRAQAPEPGELEAVRDRLGAISRLTRKYGPAVEDVLIYLDRARQRVAELEGADERLAELQSEAAAERRRALEAARRLSEARAAAAPELRRRLEGLLSELALPGARVEVALEGRDLYEGGLETVELRISTAAGQPPRPVSKVASGGELSRIALALHLLTASPEATTLVFDEVDAGVGGRAAQAVGRSLARLARAGRAQVLVVTHLPQVAAFADHHVVVERDPSGARVRPVERDERVDELSRMLAGMPESRRARAHARELLDRAAEMIAS